MNGPRLWVAEALDVAFLLVNTAELLASDWLSSLSIDCLLCLILVEAIFNTGERSPRMYITRYRSGESRGEGVAAGEREIWRLD